MKRVLFIFLILAAVTQSNIIHCAVCCKCNDGHSVSVAEREHCDIECHDHDGVNEDSTHTGKC